MALAKCSANPPRHGEAAERGTIGYHSAEKKSHLTSFRPAIRKSPSLSAHGHSTSTDAPRLASITPNPLLFISFYSSASLHPSQWPAKAAGPRPGRSSESHPAPQHPAPLEPPHQSSSLSSTHTPPSGRPRHHAASAAQARDRSWAASGARLGSRTGSWALPRGYSRRAPRRPTIASRRRSARMTRSRG